MKTLPLFLLFLLSFPVKSENLDSLYAKSPRYSSKSQELETAYQNAIEALKTESLGLAKQSSLNFLTVAKSKNDEFYLVKAYYFLGYITDELQDYGNAVIYYLEAARLAEFNDILEIQNDLAGIYKNLAIILGKYNHLELAYKFIDRGIEITKKTGNTQQEVKLLTNKVHELIKEERYLEAKNQIQHIIDNLDPDPGVMMSLKNKAGIASKGLNDFTEAKRNFFYILENAQPENQYYSYALHNLGDILMTEKSYKEALNYYAKAIRNKKEKNHPDLIGSLSDVANIYTVMGNPKAALLYLSEAETLESTQLTEVDAYKIYKQTSEIYEQLGDIKQAQHYEGIYLKKHSEEKPNIQLLTERHFELLDEHLEKLEYEKLAQLGIQGVVIVSVTATFIIFIILYQHRRARKKLVPVAIDSDRPLMTRQELARELGISYHTLWRRLQESDIKITSRKYLTPTEQEEIINYLKKKKK